MQLNNLAIKPGDWIHFWVIPGLKKGNSTPNPVYRPSKEKAMIINVVCNFYELDQDQVLRSKSRKREVVVARQLIQYFLKKYNKMSLTSIGREFTGMNKKGQDHTTVIHSIKTINDLRDTDSRFNAEVSQLENLID